MQVQPTATNTAEVHKIQAPTTTMNSAGGVVASSAHAKHNSEGSSTRSSTSSWLVSLTDIRFSSSNQNLSREIYFPFRRSEEPVAPVNMDIMTGHLILVR